MKYPSEALETSMMAKSFWRTSVPEASGVSTLGLLLRVLADFLASADLDDFEEVPDFVELLDSLDAEPLAEASAFAVSEALAGGLAATGVSAGELPAAAFSPEQPHNRALDRNIIHRNTDIDLRIIRHSPY
jgi:hypothetical protein